MTQGTVKFFNTEKGFGFIRPQDGSVEVFVHVSQVTKAGMGTLTIGDEVSFDLESHNGRYRATDLKKVEG